MFLHVGAGLTVKTSEVIGIFDLDGSVTPETTADFLRRAEKDGRCVVAGDDLPKSFVLIGDRENTRMLLSHISSAKLSER